MPGEPRSLSWWTIVVCAVVTVAILTGLIYWPAVGIQWKQNATDAFLQTFAALGIVAVFVERVVEVFVGIWQDPRVDLLQQQVEFQQSVQVDRQRHIRELMAKLGAQPNPDPDNPNPVPGMDAATKQAIAERIKKYEGELEAAETAAEKLQGEMVGYRASTRRLASWISLTIGVATASVGFRVLDNLVDIDALAANPHHQRFQYNCFVVMDALLTGAVLAGGSKAVHEVFNLYETIMQSSQSLLLQRKLRDTPPPAPAPPNA